MPDLNLHIGCHGLFTAAAERLYSHKDTVAELGMTKIITAGDYRKHWRSTTLEPTRENITSARESKLTKSILSSPAHLHIHSNPRILGSDSSIIKGGKLYAEAELRIAGIRSALIGMDVSIIIMICEVYQFQRINGIENQSTIEHPWSDLIHRIASAARKDVEVFALRDARLFSNHLTDIIFDPHIRLSSSLKKVQEDEYDKIIKAARRPPTEEEMSEYLEDLATVRSLKYVRLHVL